MWAREQNPYAYPVGRAPGFNPGHIASTPKLRHMSVATGHKMMRQFYPVHALASCGGNTGCTIDPYIGPAILPWAYNQVRFTRDTPQDRTGTVACILGNLSGYNAFSQGQAYSHVLSDDQFSGGGFQLCYDSAGKIFTNAPNGGSPYGWNTGSVTLTLPILDPVFLAFSYIESGPSNFLFRNLRTGKLFACPGSTGGTLTNTGGPYYCIGNAAVNAAGNDEKYNCAMFSGNYLSLSALAKWSESPWDFWYPPPARRKSSAGLAILLLHPDGDVVDGNWTNEANSQVNLYASIDETGTPVDTDYIQSPAPPVSGDVVRFSFTNPAAGAAVPFTISYRYATISAGTITLTVRLKCGSTTIKTWTHTDATNSPTTRIQSLTSVEVATIADFTNLLLEFEATTP